MEGRRRLNANAPSALLTEVAAILRAAAHAELTPRYATVARDFKADGSIVTAADTGMQARVQAALAAKWPQFAFLGEEMSADSQQAVAAGDAAAYWCIDPLDGTTNFANGVPFFSVSLALVANGATRCGWVLDPLRDECFMAEAGTGVWLNGAPLAATSVPRPLRQCVAVVDFKRLRDPSLAARLAHEPPFASQRNFGSCALEWCWLAAGRVHLYLHGGQKLWDYAAGTLILTEAGGACTTLAAKPLVSASLIPQSVVAAQNADLFAAWQTWLAQAR